MWKSENFPHRGFPRNNNWTRARQFVEGRSTEDLQAVLDTWFEQDVFPCMEEPLTRYGKIDYAWFDGFNWPQDDRGELLDPERGPGASMGLYAYTPEDKVVTLKSVRKAPAKTTMLATGEIIEYTLKDETMTFVIPKDKATPNLDVIKVEW